MDVFFDRRLWNSVLFVLILLLVLSIVFIRQESVEMREHYRIKGNNFVSNDEFRKFYVFENTVQKLFQDYRIIHYLYKLYYVEIDSTTRRMVVRFDNSYRERYNPDMIRIISVSPNYTHLFSALIRVCLACLSIAKLTGYRPDEVVAPSVFSSGRITVPIPEIGSDEYFNLIQNAIHYTLTRRKMVDVLQGSTRDRYLENMTIQLGLQSPEGMKELKTRGLDPVRIVDKEVELSQKKPNPQNDNRNTGSLLSRSEFGKTVPTTNNSSVIESTAYRAQLNETQQYIRDIDTNFREAYSDAHVLVLEYQNFTSKNIFDKGFSKVYERIIYYR